MGGGMGGGGGGAGDLSTVFKDFQRKSPSFKEAWAAYCTSNGQAKHDPTKQSPEFLIGFIEFLSQHGQAALSSGMVGGGMGVMGPSTTSAGMGMGMMSGS